MKKFLQLLITLIILTNCAITFADDDDELTDEEKAERGIKIVSENMRQKYSWSVESRIIGNDAKPEFILRYKNLSADYIKRKDAHYLKFDVDRELIYIMGTRAAFTYGLTGIKSDEKFLIAPTIGIALEMKIQPKLAVFTNFSGVVMGKFGHVADYEGGFKYLADKNFSWTIGWRHIDSRLRLHDTRGQFKLSGFYTGLRADF